MINGGKRNVLGVLVDVVDYDAAADEIIAAARDGRPFAVTALAVHGVMTGVQDLEQRRRLNSFDLVTPDGQPVRWALNLLYGARLRDRVYGPTLTLKVVKRAAAEGLPVYLYGSTSDVLDLFAAALARLNPDLVLSGRQPSRFREVGQDELDEVADEIGRTGARIVLVGLGCPRQEIFVHELSRRLPAPMLAVGAAFDYHAGLLRKPPAWMQRRGLEWLWRLALEPGRLWRRYLILNPKYAARLAAQRFKLWRPVADTTDARPVNRCPA